MKEAMEQGSEQSEHSLTKSDASKLPPGMPSAREMVMEVFRIGRVVTVCIIVFSCLVICGAVAYVILSAPPTTITITTGPDGSAFQRSAARYATILASHGVKLIILPSHGSEENLQRLKDPASHVDVGFVQSGVAGGSAGNLVSLGSISHQPLLVFYRGAPIELLSQLTGKRLAIGAVGSGTRGLVLTLLDANGIKEGGPTTFLDIEPEKASKALQGGTVDAAFLTGESAPPAVMRELLRAPDIHLFNFSQATAYARRFGFLSVLELPQGGIDFGANIPAHDVSLIGPTIELIARPNLHPALSDLLLDAAREVHGNGTLLQSKGEFPAPLEHDFPISADALRFYKSGKSLFYRYLPFWLASLTSRIVVVFVPMVVVLIPALRSIPVAYRWRIRSRIFRWYRALVVVERELLIEVDPAKRGQLLKRLDVIEDAVNQMKVPTFYADLFYGLRGHIDFVRQLSSRREGAPDNSRP
jgi:NMT1-like family